MKPNSRTLGVVATLRRLLLAATLAIAPASAQQIHGVPGSPGRHDDPRRQGPAAAAPEIRRRHQGLRPGFEAVLADARGAAERRAERAPHHDGRPGFRRVGHLRRRHSHARHGPHRQGGIALHAFPLDGAMLADARGAHHRPQSSFGRIRRHRRAVDRLPGLRLGHRHRERHGGHDPARQRLLHVVVRQEPQHAGLSIQLGRALRPMAGRHGLRILLRVHGRRDRPVDALPLPQHEPGLPVDRQARLQPHHRPRG